MTTRTVPQKTVDWLQAFNAVRTELTPQAMRELASIANPDAGEHAIRLGVSMARIVTANDRSAAIVAALITTTGVRVLPFENSEEPEDDGN